VSEARRDAKADSADTINKWFRLKTASFPNGIASVLGAGQSNYFEDDYIADCTTGIVMGAVDKYRGITTANCATGIVGGINVGGVSN
jgi:hypothetical protein